MLFGCAKDLISNISGQVQRVVQMNGLILVNMVFLNKGRGCEGVGEELEKDDHKQVICTIKPDVDLVSVLI